MKRKNLSEDIVHEICKDIEKRQNNNEIAKKYNVSAETINNIRVGKTYKKIGSQYKMGKYTKVDRNTHGLNIVDKDRDDSLKYQIRGIKEVREKLNITQDHMAYILDISQDKYSRSECITNGQPNTLFYIEARLIFEYIFRSDVNVTLDSIVSFYNIFYSNNGENILNEADELIMKKHEEDKMNAINTALEELTKLNFVNKNHLINVTNKIADTINTSTSKIDAERIEYIRNKIKERDMYWWIDSLFTSLYDRVDYLNNGTI